MSPGQHRSRGQGLSLLQLALEALHLAGGCTADLSKDALQLRHFGLGFVTDQFEDAADFANFSLNSSLDSIFDVCDCRLNFLKLAVDKAGTRVVRNNWIKVFFRKYF